MVKRLSVLTLGMALAALAGARAGSRYQAHQDLQLVRDAMQDSTGQDFRHAVWQAAAELDIAYAELGRQADPLREVAK